MTLITTEAELTPRAAALLADYLALAEAHTRACMTASASFAADKHSDQALADSIRAGDISSEVSLVLNRLIAENVSVTLIGRLHYERCGPIRQAAQAK